MPRHSYQLTHILFSGEMKADHIGLWRRPTRSILHSIDSTVQLLSRVQFIRNRWQQRNHQSTAADRGCCRFDTTWWITVLLFLNSFDFPEHIHILYTQQANPYWTKHWIIRCAQLYIFYKIVILIDDQGKSLPPSLDSPSPPHLPGIKPDWNTT